MVFKLLFSVFILLFAQESDIIGSLYDLKHGEDYSKAQWEIRGFVANGEDLKSKAISYESIIDATMRIEFRTANPSPGEAQSLWRLLIERRKESKGILRSAVISTPYHRMRYEKAEIKDKHVVIVANDIELLHGVPDELLPETRVVIKAHDQMCFDAVGRMNPVTFVNSLVMNDTLFFI